MQKCSISSCTCANIQLAYMWPTWLTICVLKLAIHRQHGFVSLKFQHVNTSTIKNSESHANNWKSSALWPKFATCVLMTFWLWRYEVHHGQNFSGFSVCFCINEDIICYKLELKTCITCSCFDWMLQLSSGYKADDSSSIQQNCLHANSFLSSSW